MTNQLLSSLQSHFGFSSFRPGQLEAIQSLLEGRHTLVVMPTGSGKSLVFQLTALHLPGVTLVISPLIALMKDQVDSLERRGISATFINSTLEGGEQNRRLKRLASSDYRIVYVAPERLRSTQFLSALQHQQISLLAVDEVHCISEWGHDFRPDYLNIAQFRAGLGDPLTVALTATATPQVQDDVCRLLGLPQTKRVVTGFNRPNLELRVRSVPDQSIKLRALQELLPRKNKEAAIIYTGTRRDAEEVAEFVSTVIGVRARHYHAGLPTEERTYIQNMFMAGDLPIVAATNAFGMGIDRSDVRQVIHYALPGSLEAYYQEAGRAGRDGLPARAVLLYSPEDRALQEYFIESSVIREEDLRLLFEALRPASDRHETITIEELSRLTGMQEVKVRLGMAALERAGMMEHLGDEGLRMWIKLHGWKADAIHPVIEKLELHREHRKTQLNKMIAYAESNDCRRKIILKHFGDRGSAEAEFCCDNCQARRPAQNPTPQGIKLPQSERVHIQKGELARPERTPSQSVELAQWERIPLILLDTVRRLSHEVGSEKIAQILKGSKAKDITRFGYDKNIYYGRLAGFSQVELKNIIDQLLAMGYLKVIGGKYPVLRLTPQGEVAIRDKAVIPLKLPRLVTSQTINRKKAERQAGGTLEYTEQLFSDGLTVDQIAARRELSPKTIYSHAAKLIAAGRIPVDVVVSEDIQQKIEEAIRQAGSVEQLYPIKMLLPDEIDYNVIRCVVEGWKRRQALGGDQFIPEAKGPIITRKPDDKIESPPEDSVESFLSRSHPRQLPGPWEAGWALGFHSQFAGADWNRSEAGELAFRLKYRDDLSALPPLVEQAVAVIKTHPELGKVDAVLPVPPSTPRSKDPVSSFAKALAQRLGLTFMPLLSKSRQTAPQKEMRSLAQKRANVAGAFSIQTPVKGKRLLVVDDLFDSGATLEEITRLLCRAGAVRVCVLTMTRTIHSDK